MSAGTCKDKGSSECSGMGDKKSLYFIRGEQVYLELGILPISSVISLLSTGFACVMVENKNDDGA